MQKLGLKSLKKWKDLGFPKKGKEKMIMSIIKIQVKTMRIKRKINKMKKKKRSSNSNNSINLLSKKYNNYRLNNFNSLNKCL